MLDTNFQVGNTALPKLYTSVKERVKQELSGVKFFLATCDLWSSRGMTPYMSYTVHYISEEWKLSNRCLQTQFLPEDHNAENLGEAMTVTLECWDLDASNQVCLTTDNGSNIVKAASDLNWSRVSCFGHNLHLAITKALKDDRRCVHALGISRKIVSSISNSWKRRRELTKAQIDLKLCSMKYCWCGCYTKWQPAVSKETKYLNEQENEIEDMKLFITDNSPDIEVTSQSQSENSRDQPPAKRRCLGSLFKDNVETDVMPEISKEQRINNELDRYISSPKFGI